jgi:hypothetical protein
VPKGQKQKPKMNQKRRPHLDGEGTRRSRAGEAPGKTAGRAARDAAEPVVEAAADEVRDVAHKVEGTAQDAVQTAKKVDVGVLGHISGDLGVGFLALSVSIYSGLVAYAKFRQAASGRSQVISSS